MTLREFRIRFKMAFLKPLNLLQRVFTAWTIGFTDIGLNDLGSNDSGSNDIGERPRNKRHRVKRQKVKNATKGKNGKKYFMYYFRVRLG